MDNKIKKIVKEDDAEFDLAEFNLHKKIVNTNGYYKQLHISHKEGTKYSTSHYCGVVKLQLNNDDEDEPENVVLIVEPRFGIKWEQVKEMLKQISNKELNLDLKEFNSFCTKVHPNIVKVNNGLDNLIKGVYDGDSVDEKAVKDSEFSIDIAMLYEFYCRAKIKKALPEDWILADFGEEKWVFEKEAQNKKLYLGGSLIPDIILTNGSDKTVILDVKFKDGSSGQSHREDRLQILAYQYMYNAPVIGHILPNCSNTSTEIKSPLNNKICDYVQLRLFPNTMKEEEFISNLKKVLEQAIEG